MQAEAKTLYDNAIVIDGLNVSNWDSPDVFASLRAGNLTAISATVATWDNFEQTMDQIGPWLRRFRERDDVLQVKDAKDILRCQESRQDGHHPELSERLTD